MNILTSSPVDGGTSIRVGNFNIELVPLLDVGLLLLFDTVMAKGLDQNWSQEF